MKQTLYAVLVGLVLSILCYGLPGGRYDQEIQAATVKIVESKGQFKNVHVAVDDGIVTLTGTVELESSRAELEYKVRHLAHVARVRNQVTLFPPAVPDHALSGRLSTNLRDAGYENVKIKVHNGAVVLTGVVRTERDRERVIQVAWATDGVKEVQPQLSVASY